MLGRTDSRARAIILLLVFVVVASALGVRLAYWQVVRGEDLSAMAVRQSSKTVRLPARRGAIYDRSGTVVLATSVQRDRLAATPKLLTPERRIAVADTLVGLLALQGEEAINLRTRMLSDRQYVVLARGLDAKLSDTIRELSAGDKPALAGLLLEPEQQRHYPHPGVGPETTLAAHLLGFVNREGTGQYGVEQFYQDRLAGTPRVLAAQKDAAGNLVPDSSLVLEPGSPGDDLILTIDAGLQVAVEQELLATWIADRAKRVSAVVMDPYTGEIYAYGSYPSYDANDYQAVGATEPGRFVDPLVSTVYEPGSVFKMLTATAALGDGTVTLATKFRDVGTLRLDDGKTKIDNANRQGMGVMKFKDAIAYSRNVVAAKVA
ncbi:MAG: peptidoglycan D,D-transpeptidase FtsI family protein, partial [Chloroflexota bacterium]